MNAELLALLLACKAQMEADAVELDKLTGWVRTLPKMIDQNAMPEAWDSLVAYLAKHGGDQLPGPAVQILGACAKCVKPSECQRLNYCPCWRVPFAAGGRPA